jgi:hypothetical protein
MTPVVGARFQVPKAGPTIWTIVGVSPSAAVIYFTRDPAHPSGHSMPAWQMAEWTRNGRVRFLPAPALPEPAPAVREEPAPPVVALRVETSSSPDPSTPTWTPYTPTPRYRSIDATWPELVAAELERLEATP